MDFAARELMRAPDRVWARQLVDNFPRTWQATILGRWHSAHKTDYRAANLKLLARVRTLSDSARGGIAPDAGDAQICEQADLTAADFARRLRHVRTIAQASGACYLRGDAFTVRLLTFYARHLLQARGLVDLYPAGAGVTRAGALRRLECPRFWRRVYRKLHARTVEACGIELGLVHRDAGIYASDEAVKRRLAQNARNAAILADVTAINESGQDYTLAELAATGTGNKTIRRVELLTRIAGFELIAKESGHIAYMVTVTCPSRFHRMTTTAAGRVVENKNYDGSSPNDAQKYLSGQWAKCRAGAARIGLDWYGFRIAEPQHDATPHWHVLLFMPARTGRGALSYRRLVRLVRNYFWRNESPSEPGAKKHRCDFERIDWKRGSAVGYVIKYISKNIDGHGVGLDLFGNDAITTSARVEAWASTWRIRQFQQIGGAPVTVWRELRRIAADNVGPSDPGSLSAALSAINIGKIEPGIQALAWKKYIAAQGGIGTPRKLQCLRLMREQSGECGRYGEAIGARPVGIEATGVQSFTSHLAALVPHAPKFTRPAFSEVESERQAWVIVSGGASAIDAARSAVIGQAAGASARIHVNNCTADGARIVTLRMLHTGDTVPECVHGFGRVTSYRRKVGRHKEKPAGRLPEPLERQA